MRQAHLVACLLLVACAPALREGQYACVADDGCPEGWACRADGRCWSTPGTTDGGHADGAVDGGTERDAGEDDAGEDACTPRPRPVDLLLMVDDSNSMAEEQASLVRAFPELVRALATGDVEPDGTRDFDPVLDLHVGVITSDMGVGGLVAPGCAAELGDDGVLRTESGAASGCEGSYPPFLGFAAGGELSRFRSDFACLATVGTGGCGFEQQLEAVLKALTPSTSSLRFHDDSVGHGDGVNAGFLRADSVLIVLLVTDEDDCSAQDPRIFDVRPEAPYASIPPNVRCAEVPAALHGIPRYADGLRALRPDGERLVFAALTGVPVDIETADHDALLADDRMQYRIDPDTSASLLPACDADSGEAYPARRITQAAAELELLGSASLVRSICRDDFDEPLRELIELVAPQLVHTCE